MATTPSSGKADMDSSGPRYAPEDPTLPKPWKGLIDGASGYLYYWNPETNVTQYERPAPVQPPVPAGPPPTANPKLATIPAAQVHDFSSKMGPQLGATASHLQQTGFESSQLKQSTTSLNQVQHAVSTINQVQQTSPALAHIGQMVQPPQVQQTSHPVIQGRQMIHGFPQVQQVLPNIQPLQKAESVLPQVHQAGQSSYQVHQTMVHGTSQQTALPLQDTQQTTPLPQFQQMEIPSSQLQRGPTFPQVHQMTPTFPQVHQSGLLSQIPQPGVSAQHGHQSVSHPIQVQQMGVNNAQAHQHSLPSTSMQSTGASAMQQFGPDQVQLQTGFRSAYAEGAVDPPNHRMQTGGHMIQNAPPINNSHAVGPPTSSGRIPENDQLGRSFGRSLHQNDGGMMAGQPKSGPIPSLHGLQPQEIIPGGGLPHNVPSANAVGGPPMLHMHNYGPGGQSYPTNGPIRSAHGIHAPQDMGNVLSVEAYRRHHEVTAMGENVPPPFITFEATGFPPEILREIHSAGFSSPTPIQAQTWPVALQGRDIVAIAKTGSGKTLGYLIPAFMHLRQCRNNPQVGPTVLVLAPTRELATQIQDETIKFGRSSRISCTCLYGGAPKGPQLRELERGADIVVATPGRLNDILEMRKISFRQVSVLVLDEADRMLDMGFEPQIRKIVEEIPVRRQTLMYTATWPKEVRKIAGDLLVNPVQVNIGSVDELEANKAITQYVEVVPQPEKQRRLEQILRSQEQGSKIIIFCSTKQLCDQLARSIGRSFRAAAIHGDKSQGERDWVLNEFRAGRSPILVATDVAARGLDIKDIRVVINYDFPTGIEDYVHRIGRTGRAGATGVAYTFFSDQDWKYAVELIKVLEGANQRVPPEVREIARMGNSGKGARAGGFSRWDSGSQESRDGHPGGFDGSINAFSGGRDSFGGRRGGFHPGGRGTGPHDFSGGRSGGRGRGPYEFSGGRGDGPHDFHGGRGDMFGGRGSRGRGFGGGFGGRGQYDRGPQDRFSNMNGRGRFDGRRGGGERSRGHHRDSSPEKVRTWGYSRSRSRSRSWSSRSRSRSRSRSWSRSRSRSRSRSHDRCPRRSDRSPVRGRVRERPSLFSDAPSGVAAAPPAATGVPPVEAPPMEALPEQVPPESSSGAPPPEAEPAQEPIQDPTAAP